MAIAAAQSDHETTLSEKERIAWIRLIRSQNVGPKSFFKFVEIFGSAQKALEELPEMAKKGGAKTPLCTYSVRDAEKEIEAVAALGGTIITFADAHYPKLLRQISDPPPVLSMVGNLELLEKPVIAMVGARNASINANRLTGKFSKELGEKGYVIASGFARGIDTSAHQGSLETGTIAVLGGGIDIIYPKENAELYEEIRHKGLIVAECAYGTVPQAKNFPRRNRIISGISTGIVVMEAARKSGSLITARMANEQGREVMAVPGFPLDPRAEGPNYLIKEGATLVSSVEDIIQAVEYERHREHIMSENIASSFIDRGQNISSSAQLDKIRHAVVTQLNHSPVLIDDLVVSCGASVSDIQIILLELELAGRLERHPGNKVALLME